LLASQWSPITGTNGDGVTINHILPYSNNILATGFHSGTNNSLEMPTVNVPSFGKSGYKGESGFFAHLKSNCPIPSAVSEFNIPIQIDSAVNTNISIGPVAGASSYSWFANLKSIELGNSNTTNNAVKLTGNILSFEIYAAARNACGISPFKAKQIFRTPNIRQPNPTTLSVSLPGFTRFVWYKNGDSITTQTSPSLNTNNFGPGVYQVRAVNDCGIVLSSSKDFLVNSQTKLNTLNLTVFPNPTSGLLFVEGDKLDHNTKIRLFDTQGKKVDVLQNFEDKKISLNVSHLPNGLFQIMVENKNGISHFKINVVK